MTINCWYYTYGFLMPWKDFLVANGITTKDQEEEFVETRKDEGFSAWVIGFEFEVDGRTFVVRQPTHDQKLGGNEKSVVIGIHMLTVDRETLECTRPQRPFLEDERDEIMQLLVEDSIYSSWLGKEYRRDFKTYQTTDDCDCCS
jgi:hypothetical protein